MAIDVFVPALVFFTPRWEPSDCSVVDHPPTGRIQVFCHYSQRLVALTDTVDEADALIMRTQFQTAKMQLALDFPRVKDGMPAAELFAIERSLQRKKRLAAIVAKNGYGEGDLTSEILAANLGVQGSPAAETVRRALGDLERIEIDLPNAEMGGVFGSLFSPGMIVLDYAYADVSLDADTLAAIRVTLDQNVPVKMVIERERPSYPGFTLSLAAA